ncbi:hypothetical protein [Pseudoalteromonas sp. 2CM32C]|uniref:hypothetical protein n=1 Tax=Pseudoalteromonas sp. 2CM32C TaxID=2929852 RepID=UPI0020BFCB2C|nr:hypothetical protein [Pseudoalteromonas sp. 2CM32C]MCK8120982.1 hypothetical protein [Pseudoalteromonas sp. 2CM32C]
MNKQDRILLFKSKLSESTGAINAESARNLMSELLKVIETKHTSPEEKHMVIPEIKDMTVQEFGDKGLYIPLIGHRIFINSNGAIRIKEIFTESIFLEKQNSEGVSFKEIPDWSPKLLNV